MAPDVPAHDPRPRRSLGARILTIALVVILILAIAFIHFAPNWNLNEYAISPGTAQPVSPLISVPSDRSHRLHGRILLTDVLLGQVTVFNWLSYKLSSDTQFIPADELTSPGIPSSQLVAQGYLEMQQSQTAARVAALTRLGYSVHEHDAGTMIAAVASNAPASPVLSVGQTVTKVDGTPTSSVCDFVGALHDKVPGQSIRLTIEQSSVNTDADIVNGPTVTRSVRLARAPKGGEPSDCPGIHGPSRAYLGVEAQTRQDYTFPFTVSIATQDIGGPSAGLAMTLGLIDKLTDGSLTGGLSVAATGTIDQAGDVCEVGGVPQKTIAVERAGATVFLVPPGNYKDALSKDTPQLHVYTVSTLNQALAVLRRLHGHVPPQPQGDQAAGSGVPGGCDS